jgi:hypothetical protein
MSWHFLQEQAGQANRKSPRLRTVAKYPTPKKGHMCGGSGNFAQIKRLESDGEITNQEAIAMGSGGDLNPDWVEWLMGWPIGWTDLQQLEMDRFQAWLDSHGKS